IRVLQAGRRNALRIVVLLVHTDRAVHAIVDDRDDDRDVILHGGCELLTVHQEVAVAGKANDSSARMHALRHHSRRQPVAHRAGGGRELRRKRTEAVETMDPAGEIAGAIADDGIGTKLLAQPAHYLAILEFAGQLAWLVGPREII